MNWDQEPGDPVEDIRRTLGITRPKFESGDRAWLILESMNLGWVVFVGPLAGPVLIVQGGESYFWCYLGAGKLSIENGAIVDGGPVTTRLEAKDLFRTREEAEGEARRRNGVRNET